ncbi:MAG: hypothetical protein IH881_12100 [Myxococcales bacterium]|nr:hypothetical protein [Myxococcales bacterium]
MSDESPYQKSYSEDSFWIKVKNFALAAGREVIEKALILYYSIGEPDVPKWAKGTIVVTCPLRTIQGASADLMGPARLR